MTQDAPSPFRDTDDAARRLAQDVIVAARLAALAVLDPTTGAPHVTRIAFGLAQDDIDLGVVGSHPGAQDRHPRRAFAWRSAEQRRSFGLPASFCLCRCSFCVPRRSALSRPARCLAWPSPKVSALCRFCRFFLCRLHPALCGFEWRFWQSISVERRRSHTGSNIKYRAATTARSISFCHTLLESGLKSGDPYVKSCSPCPSSPQGRSGGSDLTTRHN